MLDISRTFSINSRDPVLFRINSPIALSGAVQTKIDSFSLATITALFAADGTPNGLPALRNYLWAERIDAYLAELLDDAEINGLFEDEFNFGAPLKTAYTFDIGTNNTPTNMPAYGFSKVIYGSDLIEVTGGEVGTSTSNHIFWSDGANDHAFFFDTVTSEAVYWAYYIDDTLTESAPRSDTSDQIQDLAPGFIVRGIETNFLSFDPTSGVSPADWTYRRIFAYGIRQGLS